MTGMFVNFDKKRGFEYFVEVFNLIELSKIKSC